MYTRTKLLNIIFHLVMRTLIYIFNFLIFDTFLNRQTNFTIKYLILKNLSNSAKMKRF
jgi:hypothetical protein